jgi:hypothetical protein
VCVCERERERVCVCVSERERERERERGEGGREPQEPATERGGKSEGEERTHGRDKQRGRVVRFPVG